MFALSLVVAGLSSQACFYSDLSVSPELVPIFEVNSSPAVYGFWTTNENGRVFFSTPQIEVTQAIRSVLFHEGPSAFEISESLHCFQGWESAFSQGEFFVLDLESMKPSPTTISVGNQ